MKFRTVSIVLLAAMLLVGVVPLAAQAATEAAECAAGSWLFDDERLENGPVCIPDNPQRIISLDMPGTEFLLLNHIPIVGVFGYVAEEISVITPGLADDLANIPKFDYPPNLELVTRLQPDLIIAYKDSSLFYAGLEKIAPVVVYDANHATDWKSSTSFWSKVFKKEDAYADMLATYNARVVELQQALGDKRGDIKVSTFAPSADYPMIFVSDSAQGIILNDAGLGRPESQAHTFEESGYKEGGADYGFVKISNESLDLADGDVIFLFGYPSSDPKVAAENLQYLEDYQQTNPLWKSLKAAQAGNVHIVGVHWFRAQTYLAANLILDDLFTYLTDIKPTLPSPAAEFAATPEAAA